MGCIIKYYPKSKQVAIIMHTNDKLFPTGY